LTEADCVATERAAQAIFREHEIDVEDDPTLRSALSQQIASHRRQGNRDPLGLNVAGGIVEVSYGRFCEWLVPVRERLALLVELLLQSWQLGPGDVAGVVVGCDEAVWPGCAESVRDATQTEPICLEADPWSRIAGALRAARQAPFQRQPPPPAGPQRLAAETPLSAEEGVG
jgi:hypothetical protein